MCDVTHFYVKHYAKDVTHCYVWRDSFLCETWHKQCDSFLCVTWLISMCDVTHFYAKHDTWVSHETLHANRNVVWMEMFRVFCYGVATIIRLLNLQVSFAEYHLFNRAFCKRGLYSLRSPLVIATPYGYPVNMCPSNLSRAHFCFCFTRFPFPFARQWLQRCSDYVSLKLMFF